MDCGWEQTHHLLTFDLIWLAPKNQMIHWWVMSWDWDTECCIMSELCTSFRDRWACEDELTGRKATEVWLVINIRHDLCIIDQKHWAHLTLFKIYTIREDSFHRDVGLRNVLYPNSTHAERIKFETSLSVKPWSIENKNKLKLLHNSTVDLHI